MAGDVAGGIRGEEDGCADEFFHFAETPHGSTKQELLAAVGAVEQSSIQIRSKHARNEGVDTDAGRGPLDGKTLGERSDRGLAGAVSRYLIETDERRDGSDIDDAAVALLDHVAAEDAAGAKSPGYVWFDDGVPLGFLQ